MKRTKYRATKNTELLKKVLNDDIKLTDETYALFMDAYQTVGINYFTLDEVSKKTGVHVLKLFLYANTLCHKGLFEKTEYVTFFNTILDPEIIFKSMRGELDLTVEEIELFDHLVIGRRSKEPFQADEIKSDSKDKWDVLRILEQLVDKNIITKTDK